MLTSIPPLPIQLLDLAAQHAPLQAELEAALRATLAEGAFIQGPAVGEFAQELSRFLGGPHVIPCANGTDALQLALMSLQLPAGSEVIVPAFTYVATLEAAAVLGLVPVPVEVRPDTFNLDPVAVAAAITPRTGAIVAVHLFGQCADLEALCLLADQRGVALIEDNAQAIGATFTTGSGDVWQAGTVGEVGTTSFFPSKNLGGFGDGGALFTRDTERAAYLRQLANHGQTRKYHHQHIGLNSRLDTVQAALLRVKLPHLPAWTAARQHVAARYDALLAEVPGLQVPARDLRSTHVFHQYTLTVDDVPGRRDALQQHLARHGVPSAVYYPLPNHLQPAYAYLGYREGQFPVAEQLCRTVLSLPIHPTLTEAQVQYIGEVIGGWAGGQ
ncbi:DegT/DnrJ/EryC1/StrS family aminotransferase [Hymenobacter perfusus]|uniref:DegT/DnrJ/EryC1/StrS family aminotransferase n=1 Tax=Hymenobacter perfusus TaxID=1236770 RepID=UPI001FE7037B|nr:DegT/DnrJ/EryC1/StrS family aminotransferase [Hymenobacter perfusus]